MEMESLLDSIVELLNIIREDENSPKLREAGILLAQKYFSLKKHGVDCLAFFDREFAQDPQLYLLVLSVLFLLFKEKELLDKAECVLQNERMPYDLAVGMRQQINILRFQKKELQTTTYQEQRACQKYLLERLKREWKLFPEKLPYAERNHNRIVLATDTLLSECHAPTRLVLEVARVLQEALGMEVLLLVNVEKADTAALEACWLHPYHFHYDKSCAGAFKREYRDSVFQGYQCVVNQAHQSEVCRMLQMVADWKPECVWSIGGNSVINDLLGEITTLVASSCVNNYAVSEAELLVCFAKGSKGEIGEAEAYIRAGRQRIVDVAVSFLFSHGREDKEPLPLFAGERELLRRKWLIAIVGNRLEEEIDVPFQKVMREIIHREDSCHFLIIGNYSPKLDEELERHVTRLGYREDLLSVLERTDLFLNPFRSGGGWSALMALSAGCPVITLPDGDAAANVGEAFVCESREEIPALVGRYIHDAQFLESQKAICRKRQAALYAQDSSAEYRKVLCAVKELG